MDGEGEDGGLARFLPPQRGQPRCLLFDLAQQPLRRWIQLLEHPVDLTHDRASLDGFAFIQQRIQAFILVATASSN